MTAGVIPEKSAPTYAPPHEVRERYHALDFLRGALMLLGIAFHAALPYDDLSPWIKDGPLSSPLGFLALSIHAFRMPLFFIMAGFFAALMLSRRSPFAFVTNRSLRIGIPLLVGWAVLTPLISAGGVFALAANFTSLDSAFDSAWQLTKEGEYFFQDDTMHLWFLLYLLVFYAVLLAARASISNVFPRQAQERVSSGFTALMHGHWRLPVLTAGVFALAHLIGFPNYETSESFTPEARYLAYYGAFFAFGLLLYGHRQVLNTFGSGAWFNLALGLAALAALRLAVDEWSAGSNTEAWSMVGRAATALAICSFLFSFIGLLQRYLNRPLPAMRYIADASYWCYLVHLPLVVWMPGVLIKQDWPPEVKFTFVLVVASAACLITYELFVRWTYLGTLLQGRRYPSALRLLWRRGASSMRAEATTS